MTTAAAIPLASSAASIDDIGDIRDDPRPLLHSPIIA